MSLTVTHCKTIKSEYCESNSMRIVVLKILYEFDKNTFPNTFLYIKLTNSFWEVRIKFWSKEGPFHFVRMHSILYVSHHTVCTPWQ